MYCCFKFCLEVRLKDKLHMIVHWMLKQKLTPLEFSCHLQMNTLKLREVVMSYLGSHI